MLRCALLAFLLLAVPAVAHPDVVVADGVHAAPASFPVDLHFHRLVGHVEADGDVVVRITGPAGELVAGEGPRFAVNTLVPCCKDDAWTPHAVHVEGAATEVRLRLVLVHDNLEVVVRDAEPGAAVTTWAIFAVVAAVAALRLRQGPVAGPWRPWAQWAGGLHVGLWAFAGALALFGMVRYGGGPVAGTVAATAVAPWRGGEFLNAHAVVLAAFMVLWAVSVGAWVGAARRGGAAAAPVGMALGVGALVACLVWAVEYGAVVVPLAVGLTAAVPLGGAVWLRRPRGETR